jgi:hypothetical protein
VKSDQVIHALYSFFRSGLQGVKYRRMRRLNVAYAMGWRGSELGSLSRKRAYRSEHAKAKRDSERIESMTDLTEEQSGELARQAREALARIDRACRRAKK